MSSRLIKTYSNLQESPGLTRSQHES